MAQARGLTHTNIAVGTDASMQIGTGHVMRCLTLANAALRDKGAAGYVAPRHMCAIKDTGNDLVAALNANLVRQANWLDE